MDVGEAPRSAAGGTFRPQLYAASFMVWLLSRLIVKLNIVYKHILTTFLPHRRKVKLSLNTQ